MATVLLDLKGLDDLNLDNLKEECNGLQIFTTTPPQHVAKRISGAETIITNKVRIERKHLVNNPSIRLICILATGTDVIDLQAAKELGVTVCNCQAYGTDSVVQHVFGSLIALHNNLLSYNNAVQNGRWQQSDQFCFLDYPISELRGKTMGIVGSGNLGRRVATIAEAFAMQTLFIRRPGNPSDDRPTLFDILPQLDVLTLHCPLTDQTRNLIDKNSFSRMKPTAFLLNCARGGLVDEEALVDALKSGRIAGCATDVLSTEPPTNSNILLEAKLPNLIITPHIAWASKEARQRIIDQTTANIHAFKRGKPKRIVVSAGE